MDELLRQPEFGQDLDRIGILLLHGLFLPQGVEFSYGSFDNAKLPIGGQRMLDLNCLYAASGWNDGLFYARDGKWRRKDGGVLQRTDQAVYVAPRLTGAEMEDPELVITLADINHLNDKGLPEVVFAFKRDVPAGDVFTYQNGLVKKDKRNTALHEWMESTGGTPRISIWILDSDGFFTLATEYCTDQRNKKIFPLKDLITELETTTI